MWPSRSTPLSCVPASARHCGAKHLQDLLIEHASIDPVTGLPNRRVLTRCDWRMGPHRAARGTSVFIMADIDHFKRVNDTYGHHVGDKCFKRWAWPSPDNAAKSDLPARYGGDDSRSSSPCDGGGAARLAERCRAEVEKCVVKVRDEAVAVTASFGVADTSGPALARGAHQESRRSVVSREKCRP